MNVLDAQLEKVGTMSWHQVDINEKEDEKFDGPCRSRTFGPLIKSLDEGLPQNTQQEQSSGKGGDS